MEPHLSSSHSSDWRRIGENTTNTKHHCRENKYLVNLQMDIPYLDFYIFKGLTLEYRLDGVIPDVVFTLQPHCSCSYLPLICLSTNQNIQLIHSLLIRIEWTTGNGILVSSSHWPIYNKFPPGHTTLGMETGRNYTQLNVLISESLTLKLSDN